ncbi:hypothetical protein [Paenarthrobacter nicotinovorans]|uniref:hypothetical protein n=1 Tax=Paenarthrobacter nicotinovorans TaxID=29320 RepID=UPI000ACC14BE|nr:hypothetical protein [Paenarthrobacter nicotinovorans]
MGAKKGSTRSPIAIARVSRTMNLRKLDRLDREYAKTEELIAELDRQIEDLEKDAA